MRTLALLAAALLVVACSSGDAPRPDSASTAGPPPRPPVAGSPGCPANGLWTPCALADRMTKAGVGFRAAGDSLRIVHLDVPGVRYKVGPTVEAIAFFYPDSGALQRDLKGLDTLRLAPRAASPADSLGGWPARPYVVRSANLLMAVLRASPTQQERFYLALTAGPPQPSTAAPPTLPVVPNAPR